MEWLSEKIGLVATIDPQTVTTSEVFSDVVDMSKFNRVMGVFAGGNMAADGSMICRVVTCDSAGNNAAALKTASTVAAGTDNTQVIICVDNNDLPGTTNADRYIKFGITSAGSGGPVSCMIMAEAKDQPSSLHDLATVAEIETDLD